MTKVTIIDYGIGNLLSVRRAFEYFGVEVIISGEPRLVENADYLVLPGVGAFADGMEELRVRGLIESIKNYAVKGRPFMGICLGMQMMMMTSEEFGVHEGLGLIPGSVVRIPNIGTDGSSHKIPHIGWNSLNLPLGRKDWKDTILAKNEPGETVYFVHSYTAIPTNISNLLAVSYYNGQVISAAIQSGYLYGCQFHPEKSGVIGLKIIERFMRLKGL